MHASCRRATDATVRVQLAMHAYETGEGSVDCVVVVSEGAGVRQRSLTPSALAVFVSAAMPPATAEPARVANSSMGSSESLSAHWW